MQMADGSLIGRERGTPQGGVISPLLANLFLHYAFDLWMRRNFPDILFERYADDAICHCRDEDQATALRTALATRFAECGLTLHPEKTKIVYCKAPDRHGACHCRAWRPSPSCGRRDRSAAQTCAARCRGAGSRCRSSSPPPS